MALLGIAALLTASSATARPRVLRVGNPTNGDIGQITFFGGNPVNCLRPLFRHGMQDCLQIRAGVRRQA